MANAFFSSVVGLSLSLAVASAATIPIDIAAEANASWCATGQTVINCATLPTGNQVFEGTPFDIPPVNNAWFADRAASGGPGTVNVTIPVGLADVTTVYTLINTFWGQPGPNSYASVTFNGTNGATYTKDLVGNSDIRDYNNWVWTNSINGTTTKQGWTNGMGQRLDIQTFTLPTTFQGQTLQSITLTDTGNVNFQRTFLAGVTVATGPIAPVPEPVPVMSVGVGIAGLAAWRSWRRSFCR